MSAIPFVAGTAAANETIEGGYGDSGYGRGGYGGDGDGSSDGGGSGDEEPLPHMIVFDGSNASKETHYEFTVDGEVRESPVGDATIADVDMIDGSTVDGVVNAGSVDAYRFDGEIVDFRLHGPADVDVEYDVTDEEQLPHEIVFDGADVSEETHYEFTVDGEVTESTVGDATIDDTDVIDGSTVDGVVDAGSVDAYRFDGEIVDFRLHGPADVDVEYDVQS